MAATAKVAERSSPSLPTGASTGPNTEQLYNHLHSNANGNGNINGNNNSSNSSKSPNADIFGIINEEETTNPAQQDLDEIDGSLHSLRPWEFSNGYVKRIPAALMTHHHHHGSTHHSTNGHSLSSLSRMNSMDCWDYTVELECLNGPEG